MGALSTILGGVGSVIAPGIGTEIGAGVGALGDLFISDAIGDANDRASRRWQEKMYEEQKKFWYEQQEYNSPENQVNRLREAGINPQLALSGIQSGQMGSSPQVPGSSVSQRPTIADVNGAVETLIGAQYKADIAKENIESMRLDNAGREIDLQTRFVENLLRLYDLRAGINQKDSSAYNDRVQAEVASMMATPNLMRVFSEIENNASVNAINWLNYARGLKELEFLPQQQRLEYLERMAAIAKMNAETATEKQRKITEVQKTNREYFGWKGQKFVNSLNEKTEQYFIDLQKAESNQKTYKPWLDFGLDVLNTGLDFFNSGKPRTYYNTRNIYIPHGR